MKKKFVLSHPKLKVARLIEAAKHDVKYIKRERKKKLPEDVDYWDFDGWVYAPPETKVNPVTINPSVTSKTCVCELVAKEGTPVAEE